MSKYDRSLTGVWDWKEQLYAEVKDFDAKEYASKIRKDAESILADSHVQLTAISLPEKRGKVA
jgi:hypothetical protein